MSSNTNTREIAADFQRFLKTGERSIIDTYSLADLRSADQQCGSKSSNAGFRIAMQHRIKQLEEESLSQRQGKVRLIGYIIVIGLLLVLSIPYLT